MIRINIMPEAVLKKTIHLHSVQEMICYEIRLKIQESGFITWKKNKQASHYTRNRWYYYLLIY